MDQSNVMVDRADRRREQFWSIRTKLIISFSLLFATILLIIELVDIAGLPLTSSGRWAQQRAEVSRSLNLIADLKKDRLLRWLEDRDNDIHVFSDNELVEANVTVLQAAIRGFTAAGRTEAELWILVQTEKSYQTLVKYLDHIKVTYGTYNKIQIADAETGTIFVSTDEADLGARVFQESFFSGALRTRDDYVSDIRLDTQSQQPVLHFSHVIENEGGEVVAVLIMAVNADDIIKPMLHTGEGLGERGEALLVNQEARILTSLKHPLADGGIARPLAYQITAQPAVRAARGEEGIIEAEDYRGEVVLAAYRYLRLPSEGGWGMVVKRDKAELFVPLQQDVTYSVLISLAGMLVLVGLTVVIANGLTRPILSLSETAEKVAAGDLKARASVTTSDEVGLLATTFNAMIRRIQHWHQELEAQVKARTAELNKTNEKLAREIAERERVEETLRRERDLIARIAETSPAGITVVDREGQITFANARAEEVLDLTKDEITQRTYNAPEWRITGHDGRPFPDEELPFRRVMATGRPVYGVRHAIEWPNRRRVLLSINAAPLSDEAGQVTGMVATVEDVTEEVQAEQALKVSEARFRELFDNMSSGVAVYEAVENGQDFVFKDFNRAGERIERISKENLIGKSVLEMFPGVRDFGLFETFQRVWQTGKPEHHPISLYKDDRIVGWRENYVYRLPSGEIVAVYDDATERKQTEEALWASEAKYRSLFENMLNGLAYHKILVDENNQPIDYVFLEINDAFEKLTGLQKDIVIGKRVTEVIPGIENSEYDWINVYGKVALTGEGIRFYQYSEHLRQWYAVSAYSPSKGYFAAIFEDITERKQAEETRERLNRELMDKNKELEQIVYVASHDLRSPLVNIQGFSKELDQAFKRILSGLHSEDVPPAVKERLALTLEEDVPEALQFIFASTAKMDALLSGLLRLSRLGRAALTIQELDMNKLMANIAGAFEFQLKEAKVTLQIEYLPSCLGDETQINQVFSNLVDNGLKYLDPNRPGLIKISGHKKEGKVVYCVADNGIGIAPEHQDKIYEIFHRLDPAASSGEGLGLTIVRKILDRHGGEIWLESEPGRGSKFFVSLPSG